MFLRSGFPFNYDTNDESDKSGLKCEDESLALDSEREQADINNIVRLFGLTGQVPQINASPLMVQSFEGVFDYQSLMNVKRLADESFMRLSAEVRARFENDPQRLMAFLAVEGNRSEAEKLGLVVPKPVVVPPAGSPPAAGTVVT